MEPKLYRVPLNFDWPRRKAWEPYFSEDGRPPWGVGYQIWDGDTTPVSPVVKTEDGIILWLVEQGYSRKKAVQIVKDGAKIPEN